MCWRKCQRFVIVSPWCTQFHLAVSVNMITGIKHRRPRHPRELQLTAELHGVISQLYRSPLRSSAIEPTPSFAPSAPDPRIHLPLSWPSLSSSSFICRGQSASRARMQNRVFALEDDSFGHDGGGSARMTRLTIDFFFRRMNRTGRKKRVNGNIRDSVPRSGGGSRCLKLSED